jgi:hypothetical protein
MGKVTLFEPNGTFTLGGKIAAVGVEPSMLPELRVTTSPPIVVTK